MYEYKNKTIMINHGRFEISPYAVFSYRGEILHQCDSFVYGNSEAEVLETIKNYIDKKG